MKVYVASKFENKAAVREAQKVLNDRGHSITHDWTGEDWSKAEADGLSRDAYGWQSASADFDGAACADVVLLLADYDPSLGPMKGGLIEAGIGLAAGALVFCVGPELSIFDYLPAWHRFTTLEEALVALDEMEKTRRRSWSSW